METGPGPTVMRRRLGKQLRTLRVAAGKTPEDVATYLGVRRPTVTRIEQGKVNILPKNVRLMCQLYDVGAPLLDTLLRLAAESGQRGWWVSYSDTMPDWFADYVGLEADAEEIWSYESEVVPGLLQTPAYTRAVTKDAHPERSDESLDLNVKFRMARQEILEAASPPQLHFVVNEAALLRPVGGSAVMAEQVEHLCTMVKRSNITLQVLPIEAGGHAGMAGAFAMLRFPDDLEMNVVYLEHERGAGYLERPADLDRYGEIFRQLTTTALSPEESLDRLASLAGHHVRAIRGGAR